MELTANATRKVLHLPSITDVTPGADVALQTRAVLAEIEKRLALQGLNKHHIVKVESVLADIGDLSAYNTAYNEYMAGVAHLPAQVCCQAAAVAPGVLIDLSVIACTAPKQTIASAVSAPTTVTAEGCGPLPFSPVVQCGDLVWLSGFLDISVDDTVLQAKAVLKQIEAELATVGMTKHHIVKVDALIADIADLKAYVVAYDEYMTGVTHLPAKTTWQPAALCCGARVEICATASALPKMEMKSAVPAPTPASVYFNDMPLPFSPAVLCGDMAWMSGILDVSAPDIASQVRAVFQHLAGILGEAGLAKADIAKAHMLVADLAELNTITAVYGEFMEGVKSMPPLSVLQPKNLCLFARVEITLTCLASHAAASSL